MEHEEHKETSSFTPVIPRLDRLDRVLQLLEDKHRLSTRNLCAEEQSNKICKTISSALEEVQHKGTLIERLTALETRVLQLSLEIDEGNTSKSSSSTVEAYGKTILKRHEENHQKPQVRSSSANGSLKALTAQHKSRVQRKKKWLRLFPVTC